ncbi:hypothetical protein GCM10028784_30160 [Myceligenerans cantabricum]
MRDGLRATGWGPIAIPGEKARLAKVNEEVAEFLRGLDRDVGDHPDSAGAAEDVGEARPQAVSDEYAIGSNRRPTDAKSVWDIDANAVVPDPTASVSAYLRLVPTREHDLVRDGEVLYLTQGAPLSDEAIPCAADPDLWFSEHPSAIEEAKRRCQDCPLLHPCLQGALERREPWGVWGGELVVDGVVRAKKARRGRRRPAS